MVPAPAPVEKGAERISSEKVSVGDVDRDRFDRSKRLGWFDLEAVRSAKVTVVGCGALGNEVAKDLVLSGFRQILLVDMDHVEVPNLNRCLFFSEEDARRGVLKVEAIGRGIARMDSKAMVEEYPSRIEEVSDRVIPGADVLMGCLDNVGARLHLNSHARHHGVPYVDGATDGFLGKVQIVEGMGPCLECGMNRSHMRILDLRNSCTGEDITFFEPRVAGEITTTSVIAAVQVREALKIVHGLSDEVLDGVFYYDGMRNESSVLELETNPDCPHHRAVAGTDGGGCGVGKEMEGEVERVG